MRSPSDPPRHLERPNRDTGAQHPFSATISVSIDRDPTVLSAGMKKVASSFHFLRIAIEPLNEIVPASSQGRGQPTIATADVDDHPAFDATGLHDLLGLLARACV